MIVRDLKDIEGTEREVRGETGTWTSRRLLLKSDAMGFSMSDTVIFAGTKTRLWYKNHLEAVYCVGGEGRVTETGSGTVHRIAPGVIYALDKHDRHLLEADTDLRLVCVFNPPLTGREDHDANGAYPIPDE